MSGLEIIRRPRAARAIGALLLAAAAAAGGCTAAPPRVQHVVLFVLADPALAAPLRAEADAAIPAIPGVCAYASGTALDLGHAAVTTDFDVGFVIGFASRSAYLEYIDHPDHRALSEKWMPHVTSARTFDIAAGGE
jgi:hypothetical protein